VDINYKSLDEYLQPMKSEKRRRMKKENNRCKAHNIKTYVSSDINIVEFFPIMETIQKKYNTPGVIKKLWDFLTCLQKNMKENFIIFFDTKNEKMISMVACVKFKDLIILFKSGNQNKRDEETTLSYFAINHIEPVKYAIDNKLKKISFGTGSYYTKTLRLAKLNPLYLHLKGTSKILQFYLKIIFPIINYVKYKKHSKRIVSGN